MHIACLLNFPEIKTSENIAHSNFYLYMWILFIKWSQWFIKFKDKYKVPVSKIWQAIK